MSSWLMTGIITYAPVENRDLRILTSMKFVFSNIDAGKLTTNRARIANKPVLRAKKQEKRPGEIIIDEKKIPPFYIHSIRLLYMNIIEVNSKRLTILQELMTFVIFPYRLRH